MERQTARVLSVKRTPRSGRPHCCPLSIAARPLCERETAVTKPLGWGTRTIGHRDLHTYYTLCYEECMKDYKGCPNWVHYMTVRCSLRAATVVRTAVPQKRRRPLNPSQSRPTCCCMHHKQQRMGPSYHKKITCLHYFAKRLTFNSVNNHIKYKM